VEFDLVNRRRLRGFNADERTSLIPPRRTVLLLAVCSTVWASALPALARDSLAPPSADHRWLPREQWVTHHWLPYDERRLLRVLQTSRGQLLEWLRDDRHHTLEQLVRARGLRVGSVAERLVAPWSARVDPLQYERLRERATRTLTQGHLAQHVLFHYLHQSEVTAHAWEIFGVSPLAYLRLRAAGYTPTEIGALQGRPRASVAQAIHRVCRLSAYVGVRDDETPAGQAARFLDRQRRSRAGYLDQVLHQPRRRRLRLPSAERGKEPGRRALRKLALATSDAASVLGSAQPVDGGRPSTPVRAVYHNFAVWPVATLFELRLEIPL
jgi:hypothetical protein